MNFQRYLLGGGGGGDSENCLNEDFHNLNAAMFGILNPHVHKIRAPCPNDL